MKFYHFMCVSVLLVFIPLSAMAGLVWGPNARLFFEENRERNLDMYIDFERIETGLYSSLPKTKPELIYTKRTFDLTTTSFRYPLPVVPAPAGTKVVVLPYDYVSTPPNHRLMGAQANDIPDGQSKYEIVFKTCLDRVGLKRMWNTYSVTRFYQKDRLLAEHRNTTNHEFVGYYANPNNPYGDDCVTRVEFDGYPSQPNHEHNKLYMVGEVDDLFYSVPAVFIEVENNERVIAGNPLGVLIRVPNLADYTIKNLILKVEYLDHMKNKTVSITQYPTIKNYSTYNHLLMLDTTKETKSGNYKISVSISSYAGVLIQTTNKWYYVANKAIPLPVLHLLLRDK